MRGIVGLVIAGGVMLAVLTPRWARGERATPEEMDRVCRNWLSHIVHEQGAWAGSAEPRITGVQDILEGRVPLARCYSIYPQGHVVIPLLKELPPIKAYSEGCKLDASQGLGMAQLLRDVLSPQVRLFEATYGSLDARQPDTGAVSFDRRNRERWERLTLDPARYAEALLEGPRRPRAEVGPLLTTAWHQGDPYNKFCPLGDTTCAVCYNGSAPTYPTLVGCLATAAAQIMNYHEWPLYGVGALAYNWAGDMSCSWPRVGGHLLTVALADSYDWVNMPDSCVAGCTTSEEDAVAELCYEVGVAFGMDYGVCRSGAFLDTVLTVLPYYFGYSPSINRQDRTNYNDAAWWNLIKQEIDADRPVLYSLSPPGEDPHALVCDGWSDNVEGYLCGVHLNYGWGWIEEGRWIGWYALDAPEWPGAWPAGECLVRNILPAPIVVRHVPGSYATIQAAINAAMSGDVIEVANGTYTGTGNRDLDFLGKPLTLRSASGNPDSCVLDCQGSGRGVYFHSAEGPGSVLEGITIRGAASSGVYCLSGWPPVETSPTLIHCVLTANSAAGSGGGMYGTLSRSLLIDCVFSGNTAGASRDAKGGGLYYMGASPTLIRCSFLNNSAVGSGGPPSQPKTGWGGGLYAESGTAILSQCVFSGNVARGEPLSRGNGWGGGAYLGGSTATIDQCTFLGNQALGDLDCGGGALYQDYGSAVLGRSTLARNSADWGGGIVALGVLDMDNTIVAFGTGGEALYCDAGVDLSCCDLFGNAGGDWVGCIAGQLGINGNILADPLFCDMANGDYRLDADSPCAPAYNPQCGLIGAHGVGCGTGTAVAGRDLEALRKALYLGPAIPNPFNPVTEISYSVPNGQKPLPSTLTVYNCLGQRVRTLADGPAAPGVHTVTWDGTDQHGLPVASGVYFAHLRWKDQCTTQRLVLVK